MLITFKFISNVIFILKKSPKKSDTALFILPPRTTDLVEDAKQHRHCLS